jgi:hypothetical protein
MEKNVAAAVIKLDETEPPIGKVGFESSFVRVTLGSGN